jgi:pimeloyl-ACP methyl ester carboxylesterase
MAWPNGRTVRILSVVDAFRVIVPHLRGYGTTPFLSSETVRNAQQSVVAQDIIHLLDALDIQKATLSPVLIGERGRRMSWRCYGLDVAKRWSR